MQDKSSHYDNKIKTDSARKQSETPSLLPAQSLISSSKGTPSSNTVPSTSINQYKTKILRNGIDSLYLSYKGELTDEGLIRLTNLKKLAQSEDPIAVSLAQYFFEEHTFDVSDKGSKPFAYILTDNWYRISMSRNQAGHIPLAYVQVASELLTISNTEESVHDLSNIISSLGIVSGSPNVSRVDLCVDFVTDYPLSEITEDDWITKAKEMSRYIDQRQFSGWTIGLRKNISARLYNKTLELKKKPRPYLECIWKQAGWDGLQPVWRLEFEFRRELLRSVDIESFGSLNERLAGLWQYASTEWLRLAVPNPSDKTQSRWETASVWQSLQILKWLGQTELIRQSVDKGRPPSDKTLFINGISALTSFMAREGITCPSDGAHAFFQAARAYHDNREHFTEKNFDDYIETKVALKTKTFNSGKNQPVDSDIHPADKAVADAYREQSDGK